VTTVHEADRLTRRGVPLDPTLRVLAVATLVNTMGNGALMTTSALYFTHVIGLAPTQVGAALAVAAAVALFCQVPLGHLGDVRGPREVLLWLTAAAGVATLGLLVTRSFVGLVLVLAVEAFFDRGASAIRSGYIARVATGGRGVAFKAYLRSVTNVGITVGAAVVGSVSTDGLTPLLRWLVRTRARARRFLARPSLVFPIPVPARS